LAQKVKKLTIKIKPENLKQIKISPVSPSL